MWNFCIQYQTATVKPVLTGIFIDFHPFCSAKTGYHRLFWQVLSVGEIRPLVTKTPRPISGALTKSCYYYFYSLHRSCQIPLQPVSCALKSTKEVFSHLPGHPGQFTGAAARLRITSYDASLWYAMIDFPVWPYCFSRDQDSKVHSPKSVHGQAFLESNNHLWKIFLEWCMS